MRTLTVWTLAILTVVVAGSSLRAQSGLTTIAKGDASGVQLARQVTIRTPSEWTALWKDHAPSEQGPAVDFTKRTVVGIFLGTKPSAGHEVEIVGVRHEGADLVVEFVHTQPAAGTMTAQILTEPYHLVSVARHAGPVRFAQVPDTKKRQN
jgi:PrcB C-terminal